MGDSLQDLIELVKQWGHDRNLTAPENLNAQTMKLVSEFGEIGAGLVQQDGFEVIDGVGDTLVVAIIIGEQLGLPIGSDSLRPSDSFTNGMRYENASGLLGLFVDAVLKKNSNAQLRVLLGEFVGAVRDFLQDWDTDSPFVHNLEFCLRQAYEEIKDRKGVMYHGAFIKESDPRYEAVMSNLRMERQAGAA